MVLISVQVSRQRHNKERHIQIMGLNPSSAHILCFHGRSNIRRFVRDCPVRGQRSEMSCTHEAAQTKHVYRTTAGKCSLFVQLCEITQLYTSCHDYIMRENMPKEMKALSGEINPFCNNTIFGQSWAPVYWQRVCFFNVLSDPRPMEVYNEYNMLFKK